MKLKLSNGSNNLMEVFALDISSVEKLLLIQLIEMSKSELTNKLSGSHIAKLNCGGYDARTRSAWAAKYNVRLRELIKLGYIVIENEDYAYINFDKISTDAKVYLDIIYNYKSKKNLK